MKTLFAVLTLLAGALFSITGIPPVHAADPVILTLNLGMPPVHQRWVKAIKPWCDEIEKRSQGRLKVEPYFADALGKRSEALNSVRTGIADLAEAPFSTNPGQFPFHSQIFSAGRPSMSLENSQALMQELYVKFPQLLNKELKGARLLFTHSYPVGDCVMTKKNPVRTLAELKGQKIAFQGGGLRFEVMKSLGASVVGMSMADLYQALQSGIVDGIVMDFDPLISRRYGEEIKHVTLLNITGTGFYMVMNPDTYASLPPDLQKVMDDVSGDFANQLLEKFWAENVYGSLDRWIKEMGGTVYMLSDADYAEADKLSAPAIDAWFKEIGKTGLPAEELKQGFQALEIKYFKPWKTSESARFVKQQS